MRLRGTRKLAHRHVWEQCFGEIPEGMCVCHRCDNPPCVNPEHLFLGSHADNMRDMVEKGRSMKGERHHNAKLSRSQVDYIREHPEETTVAMGKKFGVSASLITMIRKGRRWA